MKLIELFILFDTVVTTPGDGLCDLIAIDNDKLPCGGIECKNCPLVEAHSGRRLKEKLYAADHRSEPDG